MMMKKRIFTLLALSLGLAASVPAQTDYNFFPADCVDGDGWLWFDSQDKIDRFVGAIDNDNYCANAAGKVVQMAGANFEPYEEAFASPTVVGVGRDGNDAESIGIGKKGAKTGAIVLPGSSKNTQRNGGAIVLKLPSLATLSLNVSCASTMYYYVASTTKAGTALDSYEQKFNRYNLIGFGRLSYAGNFTWKNVHQLTNAQEQTIVSDGPIYVLIQNTSADTAYVHGVRITTPRQETTGIRTRVDATARVDVYAVNGTPLALQADAQVLSTLPKGLYIVRRGKDVRKLAVR